MASNTTNLNLYKKDPIADKDQTFNITTMMNENWDKIDQNAGQTATQLAQIEEDVAEIPTIIDESLGGAKIRDNNGVLETLVGSVWIPILKEGDVMPILTNIITVYKNGFPSETEFTKILDIQGKSGKLQSIQSASGSTLYPGQLWVKIKIDGAFVEFAIDNPIGTKTTELLLSKISTLTFAQDVAAPFRGLAVADLEFKNNLELWVKNTATTNVQIYATARTE